MIDWLLIALSVLLFGSPISTLNLVGYSIAFIGVCLYNYMKNKLNNNSNNKSSSSKTVNSVQFATLSGNHNTKYDNDNDNNKLLYVNDNNNKV